ncbi:MAG: formyltetrahydrofolate deformylase [Nitrospinae bacterium]|nr:formyltetrahydrofolate deformylase [Nitrospinota bacterium]
MDENNLTAILLLSCLDQIGLIAKISQFVSERGGNIIDLDEHVDQVEHIFSIRVEWEMKKFSILPSQLKSAFAPLAEEFGASWDIKFLEEKSRIAVFVSKYDHCLNEILWRNKIGEFPVEISLIVSNHPDLEPLAGHYQIPFYYFPITTDNKTEVEKRELELLEAHKIDTIVLARYMQILSPLFVKQYPNRTINIHHSFLPAFAGGNPYKQAFDRGVKIIGATSHYVTEELDEGPIIEQDIIRITHRDTIESLMRKGRDLERMVLAKALHYHFQHRVLVRGRKTVVFE